MKGKSACDYNSDARTYVRTYVSTTITQYSRAFAVTFTVNKLTPTVKETYE